MTARNPAARRGQRLPGAKSGHATPNRRKVLSVVWTFPDPLRRGARFHSPQKLFVAELCLRARPETASATPAQRATAPPRGNQERRCRQNIDSLTQFFIPLWL